ncbi:MAG: molybdopterin molybdenumtransferase MoeA [Pseudonocardiales bacterium]|nr:MAG: molybdopterin molybdenumtransferase MoeA [Pseudonocardiales bacterium]
MTWPADSHGTGAAKALIPVDEQVERVLRQVHTPDPIELALLDAQGLLCAEEVVSRVRLPGFDNSSMDGYAVLAADVFDASDAEPAALPVVGDVAAGERVPHGVLRGQTVRIMTGAPMPAGADAVVPVEWTDGGVARVLIRKPARRGLNVRRAGEDVEPGDVAITVGTPIGPAQVGLLAAVGRERVLVHPRPRVVVISTGSELVDVGQRPGPGEIVDTNSYALAAAARDAGAEVYRVGIVADDKSRLLEVLEGQLLRADILITSGGVSAGAYDVVKDALGELGTVSFDRVAMQPGMPQGFGTLGAHRTPFFGLPGNPVSALVSFEVFVRPAIRLMLGKRRIFRRTVQATLTSDVEKPAGRRQYRRGLLSRERGGGHGVESVGGTGSHLLAGMARSNCLIVLDEDATSVRAGTKVTVLPLLLSGA